jgi:hypothetical protein
MAPDLTKADGYLQSIAGNSQYALAFTGRPDSIVFWYRFTSVGSDYPTVNTRLHVGNCYDPETPVNGNHPDSTVNIIARALWTGPSSSVSGWTRVSLPFTYVDGRTPQYIMINMTPSGNQSAGSPGSTLWLDDIAAVYNPIITAGGATTLCQGGSVTLTSSSASSYLWSNGATTQAITVTTSGNYAVTVTNSTGTAASRPTTVTVNPLPAATITASGPTTFCSGGDVVLTASAGTGNTYKWSNGATTNAVTANASGSYTVTVTSSASCSAVSGATAVTVNALPVATITASGATTFCAGGSVTLTAKAGKGFKFLWSTGVTTSAITVTTSGGYIYTVTNSTTGCSKASAAKKITVNALPAASITVKANKVCTGGTAILTASTATGDTYVWSTGKTTKADTVSAAGAYNVTITNTKACSASATTSLTCGTAPVEGKTDNTTTEPGALSTNDMHVSVYPNPYSAAFNLKITGGDNKNINVMVYDMNGRLLESRQQLDNTEEIMLGQTYTAGVYIVQVKQGDAIKQLKVVKTE